MTAALPAELQDRLSALIPLNTMSAECLTRTIESARIFKVKKGRTLFSRGDRDPQTMYLLDGSVLLDPGDRVELVEAGSNKSLYALANLKPRRYTARAKTNSIIASLDSKLFEKLLTCDQMVTQPEADGYDVVDVTDTNSDTDWMIQTLLSPTFMRLPPANIHAVLTQFEPVDVQAGQTIVREGDVGDYFYLVCQGECEVSHAAPADTGAVVLDHLRQGNAFGEDALVSNHPRNATVTMLTDGKLMRLARDHFNELMREPLLKSVTQKEAFMLAASGAVLLDVRTRDEFRLSRFRNSVNMPLRRMRQQFNSLDRDKTHVVFCESGARSAAAAFLLTERGFDARVVSGGLAALMQHQH